jgi:hypothetical protein
MKIVRDGLNESLGKITAQVPALKGKTITDLPNQASNFDSMTSDFKIAGGKFYAPNFVAKAMPGQGIDIKGNTTVGLQDYALETAWEFTDTYNLTHLRDISIEQAGILVPHVFAEGGSPIHFEVHAGCTLLKPCYSYTEIPAKLSSVALVNIGKALAGKSKEELKKKAAELIDQVAPKDISPEIKNKLKGLFH